MFELAGEQRRLALYWLEAYGGGVFLPFRDSTSGSETYGAGRYLLDTVKGADLGEEKGRLVLDFNFAYNPSCSYDPRWACPLAPPENRLPVPIRAGECQTLSCRARSGTRRAVSDTSGGLPLLDDLFLDDLRRGGAPDSGGGRPPGPPPHTMRRK